MKPKLFTIWMLGGLFCLNACRPAVPVQNTLAGYKYPIAQTLQGKYPLDQHYAISIYDEGEGGIRQVTVSPSAQNEIGSKDSVSDENLFYLENKLLQYAAFYDDWTIRQSVEVVFDDDGTLSKTITVAYDRNGQPVSLEEKTAF